jgi:TRAP-type uncharacterized transport system fused permease subunit
VTALAGVWLVSIGVVGHFWRRQNALERFLYVVAGVALVVPADTFRGAVVTDFAGLLLGVLLIAREFFLKRRSGMMQATPADS